jgi:hypothetical protein
MLSLGLAILLTTVDSAFAEFVEVGSGVDGSKIYIDRSSIRRDGNGVMAVTRLTFPQSGVVERITSESYFDCVNQTETNYRYLLDDGWASVRNPKPKSITLSSIAGSAFEYACGSIQLDKITDRIFYERYPYLVGTKIDPLNVSLSDEWRKIKACEAVVDYRFYLKFPQLQGRKIRANELRLQREWESIKSYVHGCYEGVILPRSK